MTSIRSTRRLLMKVLAIVVFVAAAAPVIGEPPGGPNGPVVVGLEAAEDSGAVYFAVGINRPRDMKVKRSWREFMSEPPALPHPAEIAELFTAPIWVCPCYYERGQPVSEPRRTPDVLTFLGRCSPRAALDLQLRYRTKNGESNQTSVHLDLAGATQAADAAALKQRWAQAQAAWFRQFRRVSGDFGGFLAYAEQQTRRQYGMPASLDREFRARLPRPTGDEMLFDVTTGALAVQESLQLDRMTNATPQRQERSVLIKDIKPVQVKSHPFDEMRGDQEPVFTDLARLVPADNYYLRFNTLNRLRELLDFANDWGPSLLRLAEPVGADYDLDIRTRGQLCLPDTILSRLLGPAVIKELVLTGSDPYVREGSDITILFDVRSRDIFQKAVDQHFREAAQKNKDAVEGSEQYQGTTVQRLVSPRRNVSCFRCWLGDVCVYSNSFAGMKRVIDVHAKNRPSLADAPDFQYMRAAVFPFDEKAEDGFLYLSDAFIRRLVGPELRIKEKRRLEAVTSLKMLENAVLFHGYQFGPSRPTMDQLVQTGCLRQEDLYDPEGGEFSWDENLRMATSGTYGDMSFLKPLVEIETDSATPAENTQYDQFRERYESYWRNYFDPIGVRIKVDRTIRLELCILPLIDLSAYNDFQDLAGGKPIPIDIGSFSKDTLFRVMGHLKEGRHKSDIRKLGSQLAPSANIALDWLGNWFSFWLEDNKGLLSLLEREYGNDPARESDEDGGLEDEIMSFFELGAAVGVQVQNPMSLVGFLVAIPTVVNLHAPNMVVFNQLEPYKGVPIVQIAPNPDSDWSIARRRPRSAATQPTSSAPVTTSATSRPAINEEPPAVYYGNVGDGFYISTQASALRGIIDRKQPAGTSKPNQKEVIRANLLVYAAPADEDGPRSSVLYFFEQQARRVSLANSAQVYLLARCGMLDGRSVEEAARAHLGYRLVCPDAGTYTYDPKSEIAVCSVHGSLYRPERLASPPPGSPLFKLVGNIERVLAYLRFTPEGLETTLEIRRR